MKYDEWMCDDLNEIDFDEVVGVMENDAQYEIGTTGRENRNNYFIVRKLDKNNNIQLLCRISLSEPVYIEGYNEIGRLSEEDKEIVINALSIDRGLGTSWERIYDNFNYHTNYSTKNKIDVQPMPDYTKL